MSCWFCGHPCVCGMVDPPVLNNAPLGEHLKQQGMARAAGASPGFTQSALDAIETCARRCREVTSDDVWIALGDRARATDNRALGPVMKSAQRRGWIEPTDRVTLTAQPLSHRSPMRIWRSLLYAGAA